MASNLAAEESITLHYCSAYHSKDRINFEQWRAQLSLCDFDLLWNPYFPNEGNYHKLDPDFILLADLDEVLNLPCHPDSANCLLWWVCHFDISSIIHLRQLSVWQSAIKKAYLLFNDSLPGLNVALVESKFSSFSISDASSQQLRAGRLRREKNRNQPLHSFMLSFRDKINAYFLHKKIAKQISLVKRNSKNFVPRHLE
jgi:hypothetical protein